MTTISITGSTLILLKAMFICCVNIIIIMKIKGLYYGISLLFIVLISVSCVSAHDTNDAALNVTDNSIISDDDEIDEYVDSFYDFMNDIDEGSGEINLDNDYVDDSDWSDYESRGVDTFSIEDSVKVNGNGHSLDWNHGPVELSVYGDNVQLRNIVFKNFNHVSDYTTAISWCGNNGLIENCTFIGNTFGTGYFNVYGSDIVVSNCKFINNEGGSIFWVTSNNNVKLTNNEFINNVVHDSGNGFICWQSEKGIIANNTFKDNRYSSDNILAGQICFDLIDCENEKLVKQNKFLNHGVLINRGIIINNYGFTHGQNYKMLVIDNDGNPVGANQLVTARLNLTFYGGEHFSEEGLADDMISYSIFNYTLKTDNEGYINFRISDLINDENIKNNGITFRYDNSGGSSWIWGEFLLNNRSEDKQVNDNSIEFEYNNNRLLLDSVSFKSSIFVSEVDSFWYSLNVNKLKITDFGSYANYNMAVAFIDGNGNELKNRNVSIKIGDKTYNTKTDKYGWASINFNAKYKTYQYSIVNPVTNQVLNSSLKVSKVFYNNKDVTKYFKSSTNYKIRIMFNGKAVKKDYVTFTINKVTSRIRTDSNGYATLKLNHKPGKYTVVAQYWGHKISNKITIKSTIVTKNVNKKVKRSGKFTVKVLNSKGKAYAKQYVKVVLKGKEYKIKTNNKGVATLSIPKNLKTGKYTVKTTYNGLTVKNTITVKK